MERRGRRCLAATIWILALPAPLAATAGDRALASFARAVAESRPAGRIRIVHFGDSHVAAESYAGALRANLQGALGDGGPGLVLPWTPPKGYASGPVRTSSSAGWRRVLSRGGGAGNAGGLLGAYLEADRPGERAMASGSFSEVRVVFLRQPGGGSLSFALDGKPAGVTDLGTVTGPSIGSWAGRVSGGGETHTLEIRTETHGKARILGVALEGPGPGAVYSSLGVIGAQAGLLLETEEALFRRQLELLDPRLVLVSFGTNEAGARGFDAEAYRITLRRVLDRLRAAAPAASIVVTAPPVHEERRDGSAYRPAARLPVVRAALREAAANAGAAFLDLGVLMGGEGSMRAWVSEGLAQPDHVHLSGGGYERLARLLLGELFGSLNSALGPGAAPVTLPPAAVVASHRPRAVPRDDRDAPFPAASSDVRAFRDPDGRLVLTNTALPRGAPVLGRAARP